MSQRFLVSDTLQYSSENLKRPPARNDTNPRKSQKIQYASSPARSDLKNERNEINREWEILNTRKMKQHEQEIALAQREEALNKWQENLQRKNFESDCLRGKLLQLQDQLRVQTQEQKKFQNQLEKKADDLNQTLNLFNRFFSSKKNPDQQTPSAENPSSNPLQHPSRLQSSSASYGQSSLTFLRRSSPPPTRTVMQPTSVVQTGNELSAISVKQEESGVSLTDSKNETLSIFDGSSQENNLIFDNGWEPTTISYSSK